MPLSRRAGLVGALVWAAATVAAARQPPQPKPYSISTTAVVIDVVVRDSRGRPVTDLRPADFELFEDGVKQTLGDVTRVGVAAEVSPAPGSGTPAAPATPVAPSASKAAVTTPTFVALVFDRLSPEARALAHKGALAYLDTNHEGDFAGVFLSDLSLVTIQPYTDDKARLRAALTDVASRASSIFDRESVRDLQRSLAGGDFHPAVPDVAGPESPGRPAEEGPSARHRGYSNSEQGPPSTGGLSFKRQDLAWERLTREYRGHASASALRAVVEGLSELPGRKTLVFFAEDLAIPEEVLPQFDGLVAIANRANVSVYSVDAAGLRVHSKDAETRREVRTMGDAGLALTADGSSQSNLAMMERNEDVLRKDPRTSLTLLADRTGGFLIDNTNDLARGVRTIDADRRFHYLLTYTPSNADFRGEWRRVEVRVPRRRVEIRSRSGYPAVRSLSTVPLLAYEGPALAALEQTPPPSAIPLRATALQFPMPGGLTRAALLVAASGQTLTFAADAYRFRTDFTLLARVKDQSGEIVRKGSQPYRLTGPAADLSRAQSGEVLFYRQPDLPPGTYTLEAAVHDALTPKAGVTRVPFAIPPATGLRVSDLVVVGRVEQLTSAEVDTDNPLQLGDRLIYPTLGEPLRRRRTDTVVLYFVVEGATDTTSAELQVLSGGRTLAELPLSLQPPDPSGRIAQVSQLPAGGLGTGNFVLRLVVATGATRFVREAAVRVELADEVGKGTVR